MRRFLAVVIVTMCCLTAAEARSATGWERLGARDVDFRGDRDTIEVGRSEGRFRQIQIRVKDAPVEISNVVVTFGNGQTFSPELRERFAEGSGSRVIDLPGERRTIKKIDFRYRSLKRREGKGRVEVYAR